MHEIGIRLWSNDGAEDWSIEINGLRHEHVCAQEMEELVEAAMVVAEKSLLLEQNSGAPYRNEMISELGSSSTSRAKIILLLEHDTMLLSTPGMRPLQGRPRVSLLEQPTSKFYSRDSFASRPGDVRLASDFVQAGQSAKWLTSG
jgi:hypothetical protein